MKKLFVITAVCAAFSLTACHGGPSNAAAGDSTGTGATGARVPGYNSADTTHHDSTRNALTTGIDSSKNDTVKK